MEGTEPEKNSNEKRLRSSATSSTITPPSAAYSLGDQTYPSIQQFKPTQIPTGAEVIGRMTFLLKEARTKAPIKLEDAANVVARELAEIYIYNLNIYPKTDFNIAKKIATDYKEFKKLVGYPSAKRGKSVQEYIEKMLRILLF